MTTLSYSSVQDAINALGNNYRLETENLQDAALQEIATANGTPTYLDAGDIFALLANPEQLQDSVENKEFCSKVIRAYLDFPQTDPEGITLSFSSLRLPSGLLLILRISSL